MNQKRTREEVMEDQVMRDIPLNDYDLQGRELEPDWGKPTADNALKQAFRKQVQNQRLDADAYEERDLWGLLTMYTRDLRQGNLNTNELYYSRYHLDTAETLLQHGYKETALKMLSYAVTVMETSQAKGGFFRRLKRTVFSQQRQTLQDNTQKSIFSRNN